jgi:ectoine hydroxylase-related dioxygenase (phytanoyl-CoA dioxygenase family)
LSDSTRTYLNDSDLDRQLAEEGFVVVPFLNSIEVESLKRVYFEAHVEEQIPFYATAHHQDSEFRKKMSEAISAILTPHTEEVFVNCDLLGASFIVKASKAESSLQPHQDWNIVDETKFRSFNVWIPLVNLNDSNGAIEVLPKSHNWIRGYRHSSIDCAYREVHNLVWENMKPLYMKAGEALIYDHALLHASKANHSAENRIAVASGVKPTEAQMYFYWNNNGMVEQYVSNTEFFMTENIFSGPGNLKKVTELEYNFPVVKEDEFYGFIGKEPPVKQTEKNQVSKEVTSLEARKPLWKVYSPMNIFREIHYRITSGN